MLPVSGYIRVSGNKVAKTCEVEADRVFVDYDINGELVGVEVVK